MGSWAEKKKLMGARWAHAHDFFSKIMGGKKKNNGRLMGALPHFSFLFQFFFQKSPTGGTIYEYIGKYKEIGGQIAHDFFFLT